MPNLIDSVRPESLDTTIELYLKRSGLFGLIPHHRQQTLLTPPVAVLYLMLVWVIGVVLSTVHDDGLSVVVVPSIIAGVGAFGSLLFVVGYYATKREVPADTAVANFFMVIYPGSMALGVSIWSRSLTVLIAYIGAYIGCLVTLVLLHYQSARIRVWFSRARVFVQMLVRAFTVVPMLMLVVFFLVLFSLFGAELWQVFYGLSRGEIAALAALVGLPAMIFCAASIIREAPLLLRDAATSGVLSFDIGSLPLVCDRLATGYLSEDDVESAWNQLSWRDQSRLTDEIMPVLVSRLRLLMFALFSVTTLLLWLILSAYLILFFEIMLDDRLVRSWLGDSAQIARSAPIASPWGHQSVSMLNVKAACIVAAIVAFLSNVLVWTDEAIQRRYHEWLKPKIRHWYVAGMSYRSLVDRDYQIVHERVKNKKTGNFNADIVVPPHASEDLVKAVCESVRQRHAEYRIVLLRAFRCRDDVSHYELPHPADWFQYIDNRATGHEEFQRMESEIVLRRDHTLGVDCLRSQQLIPDEWFGDSEAHAQLGRCIWEGDPDHCLILHPYVSAPMNELVIRVHMMKLLETTEQYRELVGYLVALAREQNLFVEGAAVFVYSRKNSDTLASLTWDRGIPFISYRDAAGGQSFDRVDRWISKA